MKDPDLKSSEAGLDGDPAKDSPAERGPLRAGRGAKVGGRAEPVGERRGPWWIATEMSLDIVGVASNDSFPASDPPSWSGMRLGPPVDHG